MVQKLRLKSTVSLDDPERVATLPLHAAIASCELFGAVAAFGRTVNLKKLSEEEWRIGGGAGFEILADGKPGLEVFI